MLRKVFIIFAFTLLSLQLDVSHAAGSKATGWTSPVQVSPTGNPDPTRGAQVNSIAVNASGLALATWDQYYYTNNGGSTIGANVETNGRWGTPATISNPAKYSDRSMAAVGGDGTMVVAWASTEMTGNVRTIEVAIRPAGSTSWNAPMVLATGSIRVSPDPSSVKVAMNAEGRAWVAWSLYNSATGHYEVQAAYMAPGSYSFGIPFTLTPEGESGIQPALALNEKGEVAIAWAGEIWTSINNINAISMRKGTSSGFGQVVRLTPDLNHYTGYLNSPAVCLDGQNLSKVTWFGAGVQGNIETAGGAWAVDPAGAPMTIISPINSSTSFITPSLACDAQGNAIASATLFDATVGVQRAQVWAATSAAGSGAWNPATKLTGLNPSKTEDIAASQAVMSPDGTLAYIAYVDHYNGVVKSMHRTATGWGTPYTLGKTTRVSGFAEVVNGDAASGTQARVLWKTSGGMVHMASDWKP
jgi:hypothetical protein